MLMHRSCESFDTINGNVGKSSSLQNMSHVLWPFRLINVAYALSFHLNSILCILEICHQTVCSLLPCLSQLFWELSPTWALHIIHFICSMQCERSVDHLATLCGCMLIPAIVDGFQVMYTSLCLAEDATYCYRCNVVCRLSVHVLVCIGYDCEHCKNGCTDQGAVYFGQLKKPCGGLILSLERALFGRYLGRHAHSR